MQNDEDFATWWGWIRRTLQVKSKYRWNLSMSLVLFCGALGGSFSFSADLETWDWMVTRLFSHLSKDRKRLVGTNVRINLQESLQTSCSLTMFSRR